MMGAQIESVPAGLVAADRWFVWRTEMRPARNGELKPTKVPYRADRRGKAKSTDPATWTTFGRALDALMEHALDGLGFALGDGYAGIDLDGCHDPITGRIHPEAYKIIALLDSYAEISPSGTGIKIFCRGELPPGRREQGHVPWRGYLADLDIAQKYECALFSRDRYFTVTGMHLDWTPADV